MHAACDAACRILAIKPCLAGTEEVEFGGCGHDGERYARIGSVVRRFRYARLKRVAKEWVVRYLMRTTGYARQQLTRLIKRVVDGEPLEKRYPAPAQGIERSFVKAMPTSGWLVVWMFVPFCQSIGQRVGEAQASASRAQATIPRPELCARAERGGS